MLSRCGLGSGSGIIQDQTYMPTFIGIVRLAAASKLIHGQININSARTAAHGWKGDRMKLTKEEALAYVMKLEEENRQLKGRCYVLSGGALCCFCTMECKSRRDKEEEQEETT